MNATSTYCTGPWCRCRSSYATGTSQLHKLLKLVKQCLSSQQHLLLEKDNQSHVFHSGFLKRTLGTFDMNLSFLWLHDCNITSDNESMILAIQDGVVATRWKQNHIFGLDVCNCSCCVCRRSVESVEHLLSSCTPSSCSSGGSRGGGGGALG